MTSTHLPNATSIAIAIRRAELPWHADLHDPLESAGAFRVFAVAPLVLVDVVAKYLDQNAILRLAATCRWVRWRLTESVSLTAGDRILAAFNAYAQKKLTRTRRGTGWAKHFAAFFIYCAPWRFTEISVKFLNKFNPPNSSKVWQRLQNFGCFKQPNCAAIRTLRLHGNFSQTSATSWDLRHLPAGLKTLELSNATVRLPQLAAPSVSLWNVTIIGTPWTAAQRRVLLRNVRFNPPMENGHPSHLAGLSAVLHLSLDFIPSGLPWFAKVPHLTLLGGANGPLPPIVNDVLEFEPDVSYEISLAANLHVTEVRNFPVAVANASTFCCHATTVVYSFLPPSLRFFRGVKHVELCLPSWFRNLFHLRWLKEFKLDSLTLTFDTVDNALQFPAEIYHEELRQGNRIPERENFIGARTSIDRIKITAAHSLDLGFLTMWKICHLELHGPSLESSVDNYEGILADVVELHREG